MLGVNLILGREMITLRSVECYVRNTRRDIQDMRTAEVEATALEGVRRVGTLSLRLDSQ
jgi:hypothetical protein